MEAARAYGNVRIFDSKNISGCLGMMVLMAQRMSTQGKSPEKIIDELEHVRDRMHYSLITDGAYFKSGKGFEYPACVKNQERAFCHRAYYHGRDGCML